MRRGHKRTAFGYLPPSPYLRARCRSSRRRGSLAQLFRKRSHRSGCQCSAVSADRSVEKKEKCERGAICCRYVVGDKEASCVSSLRLQGLHLPYTSDTTTHEKHFKDTRAHLQRQTARSRKSTRFLGTSNASQHCPRCLSHDLMPSGLHFLSSKSGRTNIEVVWCSRV